MAQPFLGAPPIGLLVKNIAVYQLLAICVVGSCRSSTHAILHREKLPPRAEFYREGSSYVLITSHPPLANLLGAIPVSFPYLAMRGGYRRAYAGLLLELGALIASSGAPGHNAQQAVNA
jgi:hypothetical protein